MVSIACQSEIKSAIRALRRATAMNRDNRTYRLALAAALAAIDRTMRPGKGCLASAKLTPEDPEVNVQLARLEARHDDLTGALRYYQNAVFGPS